MLERCLWTEASPPTRLPADPLPASTDVAIVGGGYTGLAAARALARRGADVTVLERHHLGWGASSRNGGFVLPGYKPEMEELARMAGSGTSPPDVPAHAGRHARCWSADRRGGHRLRLHATAGR